MKKKIRRGWEGEKRKNCVVSSFTDIEGCCCVTPGRHIWVRPPSPVQASCEILQVVLFNINMGENEMDFEDILFRRCGAVDKTLPGRTAEQRFISSTVGLKHSQASWYRSHSSDATELHSRSHHLSLPVCVWLCFFFPDTNQQWKVMAKGSSVHPLPTPPSHGLLLPRASRVPACWCT